MQEFDWKNNVDNKEEKLRLAKRMAKRVKNGDVIGFGSGSTSYLTAVEIGKRVKEENLEIKAIPTSNIINNLCNELNIKTTTLEEFKPDWCFDGADEIDQHNWLIKGMGAALYKEKMNMKNSNENYILVDASKFVTRLGQNHPVPIECEQYKVEKIKEEVEKLGATKLEIKASNVGEGPLITDNGNILLYAWFDKIESNLEEKLLKIDGVLESGLFIGYDIIVVK
jgi:ribose 5-phosphate isomerase A